MATYSGPSTLSTAFVHESKSKLPSSHGTNAALFDIPRSHTAAGSIYKINLKRGETIYHMHILFGEAKFAF